jgi:hypothetical protein
VGAAVTAAAAPAGRTKNDRDFDKSQRDAMMIESFVEGRVRLRSPIFKDPIMRERLMSELLKIDGVLKAEVNPRTHGLLLEYDKERLPLSWLRRIAPSLNRLNGLTRMPETERASALEDILGTVAEVLSGKKG